MADRLTQAGIGCPGRLPHARSTASRRSPTPVELPATDAAARTHLAIPMSPVLGRAAADAVVAAARG